MGIDQCGGTIEVALSGVVSEAFQVPDSTVFIGLLFPAMDDGACGLEISIDGTNFYPVLDPTDGEDVVIMASGSDPGWIDISDFVRFMPSHCYIRITCAAQDPAITITWYARG